MASKGQGHYYRIQGKTFILEYDNTQNNANHVHAVWRDFHGDFVRDLLRDHTTPSTPLTHKNAPQAFTCPEQVAPIPAKNTPPSASTGGWASCPRQRKATTFEQLLRNISGFHGPTAPANPTPRSP